MDMAPDDQAFLRVEPSDPTRCGATGQNGEQCPFQSLRNPMDPSQWLKVCKIHQMGSVHQAKKEAKRLYNLTRYRARVDRLSAPDVGTNLDEELGVLRMMLESLLERYEEVELITGAGQISALVRDIRDTLVANKKIKSAMGELLDRAAMNRLCDELVGVICQHAAPDKMDAISAGVAGAVAKALASRHGE